MGLKAPRGSQKAGRTTRRAHGRRISRRFPTHSSSSHAPEGGGGAGNLEAGSDPSFSAIPVTYRQSPGSHAPEGGGGAGNQEAGIDPGFSATPFAYQQSKRGGAVHSNWDPFPQQAIQGLCKAQAKFGYEREYFCNRLKANLARNTTVPFDLQKDLLPELWQNPETAVDNKNLPIQLAIQPDGSFQPYSKIKQLPSEPFVTFVERLTRAIELQVKNEGAQEQVLEEMALADGNEQCKAAILSLSIQPASALHDMLQQKSPDVIVKDPATRGTKSPHDQVTWGHGYAYVSTPPGLKWVPAEWVKPFIPKTAKPPAEAPQVASADWRRRKRQTFSF
ncbi:hypothetical protein DUI87_30945 [Hirundo rustica rustica]|uniref:Retroviral nucleocapsid Gag protein p24 C-terminal domain-containing protein n=1 Tax=Hirundo rustica rustica TaxID=333673 RepID=A0A3M0JD45_HIRRU|nr:hypothetical protein DUI87_30945 [Hirundo rustica rustica]